MTATEDYSIEKAVAYRWASVSGALDAGRQALLETYLIGTRILDAGCGGGAYVNWLTERGYDVTGVDRHAQFLDVARTRGYAGSYVQADLLNLPFPDASFDSAYCFDVLEHIDDAQALSELARVTTKRLVLAVPREDDTMCNFGLTFLHYQDKTHLRNYTVESLRSLVSSVYPASVRIFPELLVPLRHLARTTIVPKPLNSRTGRMRQRMLYWLYCNSLRRLGFQEVYTGLVAVVDLR